MDDDTEGEVLQMFSCGWVEKIKMEAKNGNDQSDKGIQASNTKEGSEGMEEECNTIEVASAWRPTEEEKVPCNTTRRLWMICEVEAIIAYTHPFWARAAIETRVKLKDFNESL